jgi:hypothetical protein
MVDPAGLREMLRAKQALEVRLAWELLEVFNDPKAGFITRLQGMVSQSVDVMDQIATSDLTRMKFEGKWKGGWNKYACCTDNGIVDWHPGVIKFKVKNFIAQHCADWIRIFGEVIEDVAQGEQDAIRKSFQKGEKYHWTKFNPKAQGPQDNAGRRRVTQDDRQKLGVGVLPDYDAVTGGEFRVWGFMQDISPSAGINRWRIMESDTIGKMDQVFGLMPAATISGTTTDNIYFFQRFQQNGLDPVFYLLPLATIVAPGHHSMLEVGLPLSLNGHGDYKVGLYTTLFPSGSQSGSRPAGVDAIRNALIAAELHRDNHLMLVYYNGSKPAGCLFSFNAQDREKWKGMVTGTNLLGAFRKVAPWPNEGQVRTLMESLNLA